MSRAARNRALLARQGLLTRTRLSPATLVARLVGLQAQIPGNPYVALWSRLADFEPNAAGRMLSDRRLVRTTLMRGTIHLVTAADARAIRPLLQAMLARGLEASFGKDLRGVDVGAVVEAGRGHLSVEALTGADLGARLHGDWPQAPARSLAYAVQYLEPLVQVPPRGVWGEGGPARWMTTAAWLDGRAPAPLTLETLVWRYLGAFGPASVLDAQAWSGLARLRDAFEALRPRLRRFTDEDGRELFDLPRAPRPAVEGDAGVRFASSCSKLSARAANGP